MCVLLGWQAGEIWTTCSFGLVATAVRLVLSGQAGRQAGRASCGAVQVMFSAHKLVSLDRLETERTDVKNNSAWLAQCCSGQDRQIVCTCSCM